MKNFFKKIFSNNNTVSLVSSIFYTFFIAISYWLMVRTYTKQEMGQWIIYYVGHNFINMVRFGLLFIALIKFLSGSKNENEKKEIIGSVWILCIISSTVLIIITYIIYFLFTNTFINKGFILFFKLFPYMFISIIPSTIAIAILTGQQKFKKIFIIKIGLSLPMIILLIFNKFLLRLDIYTISLLTILTHLPITIYCISNGSSGIQFIHKVTKRYVKKLLNFGKYSMLTLLAANLLRSSDIYIIGLMMTNVQVAIYGLPLNIISVFDTGLNSFCDVALPIMSKEAGKNNISGIRQLFYKYSGFVTILIIIVVIIFLFIEKPIIWIIGGLKYMENPEIFYVLSIFLISFVLQPFERFTGVALDSINKPGINLFKVIIMAIVNIIGDIMVIILFNSITAVALVTFFNIASGVILGTFFLKKEINISMKDFLQYLKNEIKNVVNMIKTGL